MKSLKKGFTLVELMVVIVIIGILAALAIPRFLGATNKGKATEFKPVLKQIYTLETAFQQERTDGRYGSLENIGWDPPGFNGPVATATATNALFSYNIGNTTINGAVGDQRTAMSTGSLTGIAIAAGASLAIATPNDNGVVSMKSSTGAPLVMGTDNVCVVTSGELHMPAGSVNLVTIAGAVPAGTCL